MDLDVVMRSSDCPYIVQFYGALFREVKQVVPETIKAEKDEKISPANVPISWLSFRGIAGSVWNSWLPR